MIKKILSIENVGIFKNFNFKTTEDWNGTLEDENLIYAENGTGKTTLSTILRDLKKEENNYILDKKTVDASEEEKIYIKIIANNNSFEFKNEEWTDYLDEIEVFDSKFIFENIYTGDDIKHEHKKNLHSFVIGQKGVKISKRISEIDKENKKLNSDLRDLKCDIVGCIDSDVFSVDEFVEVEMDENINEKIASQKEKVKKLTEAEKIKDKRILSPISIEKVDIEEMKEILKMDTEEISKQAEEKIKKHIENNLDDNGESWLEYGIEHTKDNTCPFCGCEDVFKSDLVKAYQDYFSKEYKEFKNKIEKQITKIKTKFKEEILSKIQTNLVKNKELMSFWNDYIDEKCKTIDYENLKEKWNNFKGEINNLLEQKNKNPLESIEISSKLQNYYENLDDEIEKINQYNEKIEKVNDLILKEKEEVEDINLEREKQKLKKLKAKKKKKEKEVNECCKEYSKIQSQIEDLHNEKDSLKDQLDEYITNIMNDYKDKINNFLFKFGADFEIKEVTTSYRGGSPSVDYKLKMNDIPVENDKGYKHVLSEGEKSTLAFSFFLAKIHLDDEIKDKVIVFDDPISSLDIHRKQTTAKEIKKISKKAKQVIVLTHDLIFAKKLWEAHNKTLLPLKISNSNNESSIVPWEINKALVDDYFKHYEKLCDFLENKYQDLDSVSTSMRCLLEGNLRMRFPNQFSSDEWLGDFIEKIKKANKSSPLFNKISDEGFEEIKDINDYSKKFHHHETRTQTEPINKRELKAHVRRTINFCTG